jgi:hypothetical protein
MPRIGGIKPCLAQPLGIARKSAGAGIVGENSSNVAPIEVSSSSHQAHEASAWHSLLWAVGEGPLAWWDAVGATRKGQVGLLSGFS